MKSGRNPASRLRVGPQVDNDVLFPRLDEAQIAKLESVGRRKPISRGEILFATGDADYDLVLILAGELEIIDDLGTEDEEVLTRFGPRQFAGELSLITKEPPLLSGRVSEAGEAVFVDRDALGSIVARDSRLGDLIVNALIARRTLILEFEGGARLIGSGADPATRELREFLARNRVPHRFVDLDADDGPTSDRLDPLLPDEGLPLLVAGETVLRAPSILEAATALNLRYPNKTADVPWDTLIVGGGPGGLGAAVYAATEGLSTMLIDAVALGGQASTSARIENYLGFPAGISGGELADRAIVQARRFGLRTAVPERATGLRAAEGHYVLALDSGDELAGRTVVLATGASYRQLPIAGIGRLEGAGVFHAATHVESQMCGRNSVAVIGGGNSAGQAAVFLSGSAERVSLILRGPDLRAGMSSYLVDQVESTDNIDVLTCTEVREVGGDGWIDRMVIEDNQAGGSRELSVGGLFIFVGAEPCNGWLDGMLATDDEGFLLTGAHLEVTHLDTKLVAGGRPALPLETSLPGVFAVGDGRSGSIKRVASAVGEGSMVVRVIHEYLALQRAPGHGSQSQIAA